MFKKQIEWSNITVDQFLEINDLKELTEDEYNTHLLSILFDIDIDIVEELDYNEYVDIVSSIAFLKLPPSIKYKETIVTQAGQLDLIPFEKISIGEFIDLESLFGQGYIINLKKILAICYRVKNKKDSLLYEDDFEPYGTWINYRSQLFSDVSIIEVFGILNKYIKFRSNILEVYSGLFNGDSSDEEEEDLSNESSISRSERLKEEARNKSVNKWGWDIYLLKLANNDPTKIEEATNISLIQSLNILSMKRELNIN